MQNFSQSLNLGPIALFAAIALVAALGMHTIQFDHSHPEAGFGHPHKDGPLAVNELPAALHGENKKFFALLLLLALVSLLLNRVAAGTVTAALKLEELCTGIVRPLEIFDPMRRALRVRTLQPIGYE